MERLPAIWWPDGMRRDKRWRPDGELKDAMRRHHLSTLALICAAGLCAPALALAQTAPVAPPAAASDGDHVVQYPTAYFTEFQVSTAFDMVLHLSLIHI